ncbi:hypothetical protein PMAYCL1PPCAC_32687, partial [Pristionchus mayeri]
SLSLLLLLAAAVYAQEITDNGYALPEYDPIPTEGDPTETEENTDWAPEDRELEAEGDEAVVDNNDVDGGRAELAFHGHGHGLHHGYYPHPHAHGHHFHFGGRPCGCRRPFHPLPPKVIVTDRHRVIGYPKKPCKKIVKHVTVHAHLAFIRSVPAPPSLPPPRHLQCEQLRGDAVRLPRPPPRRTRPSPLWILRPSFRPPRTRQPPPRAHSFPLDAFR